MARAIDETVDLVAICSNGTASSDHAVGAVLFQEYIDSNGAIIHHVHHYEY